MARPSIAVAWSTDVKETRIGGRTMNVEMMLRSRNTARIVLLVLVAIAVAALLAGWTWDDGVSLG
jgi:hypothetical protein